MLPILIGSRSKQGNFGPSKKDKNNAEQGIQQTGTDLYDRTKQTDAESQQYGNSFNIGQFLQQYLGGQNGMNQMPGGAMSGVQQFQQDNPLAQTLYNQTLSQAQDPDKYFNSTLQPDLMQAQDTINTYYQKRGLLNSGLSIESMGRAGVDLALKDAQARMANRQQSLQNAQSVNQNIYGNQQQNFANLANLYSQQQGYGQNSLNRQAGGAQGAAQYQVAPYTAQLGNYYGGQQAMQALPGQLIGAGGQAIMGVMTGGASMPATTKLSSTQGFSNTAPFKPANMNAFG